jgi:hypothetical protein
MPIRHGGIFANRASTWPRNHFCRSTITPEIETNDVERVFADVDADDGDQLLGCVCHSGLLGFGAPHKY